MTTTSQASESAAGEAATSTSESRFQAAGVGEAKRESVPQAPKLRRRPVLVAASVAAVCLGALLGGWAWTSTSQTHVVVAVRQTMTRGERIDQGDLMTVQVRADPGLKTIPGDQLAGLVGKRAALDMAAGSLVTGEEVAAKVLPERGKSVVGVALPSSLMPGEALVAGDQVRIVATPGPQGEVGREAQPEISATVVGLYPTGENGQTVVAVELPQDRAAELAARSATGKVALVLDSRER
ncbi:MAG TPA: SAF domain-containing protein [Dermatophilaceae bacterium]|nr:SAF domain-containing protein [Dermatophilaceae bacterium]